MMAVTKNPLASVSRFAASACTAKNVPDHHGARVGFGPDFIDMESGKADTFPTFGAPPPARDRSPRVSRLGGARFGGFPEQGKTVDYSRDFPHLPFATAMANLGASRRSSQLDRLAFGLAGPFGQFRGNGVGALVARIFKVSPSSTIRLAIPSVKNSEFAA